MQSLRYWCYPQQRIRTRRDISRKPYSRDPRHVAHKAEAYLKSTGIADTSYWGPEAEFYIFDTSATIRPRTAAITSSIPEKASGTREAKRARI
jgi:glutamine synthetase